MENIIQHFYGCLKFKETGYIQKKKFNSRQEARNYITKTFDQNIHDQCWTE